MRHGRVAALTALLLGILLPSGCSTVGHQLRHLIGDRGSRLADDVVIVRDEWGVAHVHGRSDAAAAFGAAWAMAEDNYWQVEEGYIEDLGLASWYYGASRLGDDLVRAAFRVEEEARAEYARESAAGQQLLTGFAEGLNYYLRKHPEAPRRVMTRYEPWMVLARARRVMAAQLVGGVRLGELAQLLGEPAAGWRREDAAAGGAAWAVAPARSASGRPLLLASIDRPFFGGEQPYELELSSESGWHVYGFARLGTPVPYTGHNQRLGWGHAGAATDSARLHVVVFDHPSDSLAYRAGDGWEQAAVWVDTIQVNAADGVDVRPYRFVGTARGPVVGRRGDTAWVAELPRLAEGGSLQQWYAMGRAGSLAEFVSALDRRALPGVITIFADDLGNILRHDGGEGPPQLNPPGGMVVSGVGPAASRDTAGWTLERLEALALGGGDQSAAPEIEQLVYEWEQVGGRNSSRAFALDSAVERLRRWDGTVTAESTEAILYHAWQAAYREQERSGISAADAAFPRFLALEDALARLRRDWGGTAVAWSEVSRLQRRHTSGEEVFRDEQPSVGVAGLPDGSLFMLRTVPGDGRRRYAVSGTAAVLLTELGTPPRARSIVVFGQSADATSPHFFDQAAKYARGELKDAWFGAEPLRAHGRTRYRPGERVRDLQGETTTR